MKPYLNLMRFSFKNLKIRNKLIVVYSILIFLSTICISDISYYYSKDAVIKKSISYTMGILEEIDYSINIRLEQIDLETYLIYSNNNIINMLQNEEKQLLPVDASERQRAESTLIDVMFSQTDIDSIYLFTNDGERFGTNNYYIYSSFNDLERYAKQGDGEFVYLDADNKNMILPVVRLVNNSQIQPIGVLLVNIRLNSFESVFSRQILKLKGNIYLVNGNNEVIASLDESTIGKNYESVIPNEIKKNGIYTYSKVGENENIITSYTSKFSNWKYVSVVPAGELTKEVGNLRRINIAVTIIVAVFFILISFMVSKAITEPINNITKEMKKLKIGDSFNKVVYDGNDEVSYLSKAFNEMVFRINTLVDEVYEQKLMRSEQEFKALQAQINPHFLYNTLDIINWIARSKGAPEVGDITKALSDILRYSISNKEDVVTIEDEISHVKNYIAIQMVRIGDKLKVIYDVDSKILGLHTLKLTLQPIVENSIFHGFDPKHGLGTLIIRGSIYDDKICIQVIDDGIGIEQDKIDAIFNNEIEKTSSSIHTGIGIMNVDKRLKHKFGEDYGIKIRSKINEGTTVELWLPLV